MEDDSMCAGKVTVWCGCVYTGKVMCRLRVSEAMVHVCRESCIGVHV